MHTMRQMNKAMVEKVTPGNVPSSPGILWVGPNHFVEINKHVLPSSSFVKDESEILTRGIALESRRHRDSSHVTSQELTARVSIVKLREEKMSLLFREICAPPIPIDHVYEYYMIKVGIISIEALRHW